MVPVVDGQTDVVEMKEEGGEEKTCCICFECPEEFAVLPCCGDRPESTTKFCKKCIGTICMTGPCGVGKCPRCRKSLGEESDGSFSVKEATGQCRMCRGNHVIMARGMCEKCNLGERYCFIYECDNCHRNQRIPHPMFIYQPAPQDYSTSTWACHQRCGDYTHWRIVESDIRRIPLQLVPESWGMQEAWMESVRRMRQANTGSSPLQAARGGDGCNIS